MADGPEWSKLGSITEQNDLDDLMTVAHLAGKEFTAGTRVSIKLLLIFV